MYIMGLMDRIKTLRIEAEIAGDTEMVSVCDQALNENREAIIKCERILNMSEYGKFTEDEEPWPHGR